MNQYNNAYAQFIKILEKQKEVPHLLYERLKSINGIIYSNAKDEDLIAELSSLEVDDILRESEKVKTDIDTIKDNIN